MASDGLDARSRAVLIQAGLGDELGRGDLGAVRAWLSRQSDAGLLRVRGCGRLALVKLRMWEHGLQVRRLSPEESRALNRCVYQGGDVGALLAELAELATERLKRNPARRQQAKLERTAYHEAGHMVAAIKLGIRFSRATIVADGAARGGKQKAALFARIPRTPAATFARCGPARRAIIGTCSYSWAA